MPPFVAESFQCAGVGTNRPSPKGLPVTRLGTAQFGLRVKVNVPDESATLADADKAARSVFVDNPARNWTLVDELGGGHPVQLAINDFLEVRLQRVETCDTPDELRRSPLLCHQPSGGADRG